LFNLAYARHNNGQFVLRIEDTDQARSTPSSETAILQALQWLGLNWDEGPDKGGAFGPYRQSERTAIYQEHVSRLIEAGHAYPCFCSSERLASLRQSQEQNKERIGYDGHCAHLSPEEVAKRQANGEEYVIRLKTPETGTCHVEDLFRGTIDIDWVTVDDQILLKADGYPTYHLANVIDDHLMQITHVIRGEEWINSAPKHILLYQAFGWDQPVFAHLPLLRNPDKSKLSKRKNPTGILYYRQAGFLPQTLLNYLGLMAYRPEGDLEIFDLDTFVNGFDLERVSLGSPVFDLQKLQALNGHYIRELSPEALWETMKKWLLHDQSMLDVVKMAQPRLEQLSDFVPMAAYLFDDKISFNPEELENVGKLPLTRVAEITQYLQWEFEKITEWTPEGIRDCFHRIAEKEDIKFKQLLGIYFVIYSGRRVSLPLFDALVWMGSDMALRRLHYAQDIFREAGGGLSKKAIKRLEKAYQEQY
jgi:glutamyl-tRNA synthetase